MSSLDKKCIVCGLCWNEMKARLLDSGNIVCVRGDDKEECLQVYLSNRSIFRDMPIPLPPMTPGLANLRFGIVEERVCSF